MNIVFIIFITVAITWIFIHEVFYSPKARIKQLWKEILSIAFRIGEQKKQFPDTPDPLVYEYEKIINKKERMINALLDYHFDPEEDQEYITENRPENKK